MKLQKLRMKHGELIDKQKRIANKMRDVENAIAEKSCPFKVGDRVVRVNNLFARDVIYEVVKIRYSYDNGYVIDTKKIKTNGDLYQNTMKGWSLDKWELVT